MTTTDTLVLGLGNDLLSDDGFGPAVASACRDRLEGHPNVTVETATVAGFNLLDLLAGYRRALIVDVVQTGRHEAGTVMEWPLERAAAGRTLGGSHQLDLVTAIELGRRLGYALPESITVLVAEAADLTTIAEQLTPPLAAAVPRAVESIVRWVEEPSMAAPVAIGSHHEIDAPHLYQL